MTNDDEIIDDLDVYNELYERKLDEKVVKSDWDSPKHKVNVTDFDYTISFNESEKGAMQDFFVGIDYIYVTRHKSGEKNYCICKCSINNKEAREIPNSAMEIVNGGHGSTLDLSVVGTEEFLVGAGAYESTTNGIIYSRQLGVIKYVEGGTVENGDIKRIGGIRYANKDKVEFCSELRSAVASLTPNRSKILIYARGVENKVQYSMYNYENFKSKLSTAPTSFSDKSFDLSGIFSCVQEGSDVVLPNGDFQGIAVGNEYGGVYSIYIASGNQEKNLELIISKMNYNTNTRNLNYKGSLQVKLSETAFEKKYEMEGLDLNSDSKLYFGLVECGKDADKQKAYICSLATNAFDIFD